MQQELEIIAVLERFLPPQLNEHEMKTAIDSTIGNICAHGIKYIGLIISSVQVNHTDRIEFARASAFVSSTFILKKRQ